MKASMNTRLGAECSWNRHIMSDILCPSRTLKLFDIAPAKYGRACVGVQFRQHNLFVSEIIEGFHYLDEDERS